MSTPLKVLIVDDDQILLDVCRTWLEKAGHHVTTLDSPFGTTRTVLREQPDVVLLDVSMPGLDGPVLATMLGLRHPDKVQIIFLSGRPQAELDRLAKECQVSGAIQKTPSGNVFLQKFNSLVMKDR